LKIAVEQDITYAQVLGLIKAARNRGLKAPVLLMGQSFPLSKTKMYTQTCCAGYYNPVLAYGEQKAIQDAHEAGANGFIIVDLPPEEATAFRNKCATAGYAPSPIALLRIFFIVAQRFLCPFDRTIDHPPEDQVLDFNC
jgi:tryptophan synthase